MRWWMTKSATPAFSPMHKHGDQSQFFSQSPDNIWEVQFLIYQSINLISTMSVDALTRAIDKITDNFYRTENKAEVSAASHRAQEAYKAIQSDMIDVLSMSHTSGWNSSSGSSPSSTCPATQTSSAHPRGPDWSLPRSGSTVLRNFDLALICGT